MKTVLFVPGFGESRNNNTKYYEPMIKVIEENGYKVVFMDINWRWTTVVDWVKQLDKVYSEYDPEQTILAGFSFGALTAFVTAASSNPSELWLFSLSPYFEEDLQVKYKGQTWSEYMVGYIGKRRMNAFSKLSFYELAKKITCSTLMFAGQQEIATHTVMGKRANNASKLLENNKLIIIAGTGHDISANSYIRAIRQTIGGK